MTRRFQPRGDMVLLKPVESDKIGRFYIPDKARPKPMEASVVAVGRGNAMKDGTIAPLAVQPGDHVYLRHYFEAAIEIDGEAFLMVPEGEILGIREAS